jgi:hypothetical protein
MTAHELADQAAEVAAKMKPGTWDAVQALALVSIAQSLVPALPMENFISPGHVTHGEMKKSCIPW